MAIKLNALTAAVALAVTLGALAVALATGPASYGPDAGAGGGEGACIETEVGEEPGTTLSAQAAI